MSQIMYIYILLMVISIALFCWNNMRSKSGKSYSISKVGNNGTLSPSKNDSQADSSVEGNCYCSKNELKSSPSEVVNDKKTVLFKDTQDLLYRFQISPNPQFEYLSPSVYKITGFTQEEHYNDPNLVFNTVYHDDMHILIDKISDKLDYSKMLLQRWYRKDGNLIWIEEYCTPIYDSQGTLIAVEGICRDVTERIQRENSNKGLNPIDHLTRMYNRTYFKHILKTLSPDSKIGVIVVGINNLRSINYSMGYETGTYMILKLAGILKSNYVKGSTLARIGDKDFGVIFENASEAVLESLSRDILKSVLDLNNSEIKPQLEISIGFCHSKGRNLTPLETFLEADKNMYNNSLKRSY